MEKVAVITNIIWDTDDEKANELPSTVEFCEKSGTDINGYNFAELLSQEYGYCAKGFNVNIFHGKVWCVNIQWTIDYECGSDTKLFALECDARKYMESDIRSTRSDYTDWEYDKGERACSLYEYDDYSRNHCDWNLTLEYIE